MTDALVKESWSRILDDLQGHVGEDALTLWLRNTLLVKLEPSEIEVGVPSLVVSDWIESKFSDDILNSAERVAGFRPERIRFSVNGHLFREMRKHQERAHKNGATEAPAKRQAPRKTDARQIFNLNERYTLDRMILGPNNQLAYNCALDICRKPGEVYNPFFVFGKTGVGKTHLVQGIARELMERSPSLETFYVPAEYFVNQYVQAIQRRQVEDFRKRFRSPNVLLIDDLHFLAGKDACQTELLHTLNDLERAGKQVILASDQHPRALEEFTAHLTTRFMQGMVAEIELPPLQTRLAIINSKIEGHRKLFSPEVVAFLADQLDCNVREIEGYVTRLVALAGLTGEPVSISVARQALHDFVSSRSRMVELTDIENVVIAHFGVSSQQLHGRSRKRPVALARQVCMYLARTMTSYSLKEIGRFFGNKNHTTVVFSVQSTGEKMEKSPSLRGEVEQLRTTLLGERRRTKPA